ncbi:hypothetical protein H1C71_020865, partial [Ictidomys tridecemlineatus]
GPHQCHLGSGFSSCICPVSPVVICDLASSQISSLVTSLEHGDHFLLSVHRSLLCTSCSSMWQHQRLTELTADSQASPGLRTLRLWEKPPVFPKVLQPILCSPEIIWST